MGPATRDQGFRILEGFRPNMGRAYSAGRNFDHGPGRHTSVSGLSPYLRRRLITEEEVIAAALDTHGFDAASKFIEEVFWRSYFKGWLEQHPMVWARYRRRLREDRAVLAVDRALADRIEAAERGQTGLDCFDVWANELVATGYLHNHARMWFASIWIFTFGLPWRLGADFFYRHLLDGDPASNTLGWRWVAGLHSKGKAYAAKAWNINKFTTGRFDPDPDALSDTVTALEDDDPTPPVEALRPAGRMDPRPIDPSVPTALLITEEDCVAEDLNLPFRSLVATATLSGSHLRSDQPVGDGVAAFEAEALADAAARAVQAGAPSASILSTQRTADLVEWAAASGAGQIVTPYVSQGPMRDWLRAAEPDLNRAGIGLTEIGRDWDAAVWPHARAGYFKVKARIPDILADRGLWRGPEQGPGHGPDAPVQMSLF